MLYHVCFYIFFYLSCHPRTLHSFPTRRSSDLSHSFRASRARGGGVRRHCALARSRHSHGAGWKDRSQSATDVIPSVDNGDRKSTRLNSSHRCISYAVFCLKKKCTQVTACSTRI